jgi:hypothetical protein
MRRRASRASINLTQAPVRGDLEPTRDGFWASPWASITVPCGIDAIRTTLAPTCGSLVDGTFAQMPGSTSFLRVEASDFLHVGHAKHVDIRYEQPPVGDRSGNPGEDPPLFRQIQLEKPVLAQASKSLSIHSIRPSLIAFPTAAARSWTSSLM